MRHAVARIFVAVAAVIAAESSCAKAVECSVNSDCPKGEYCLANHCRLNCSDTARDCPAGTVCDINGQCTAGDAGASLDATVADSGGSPSDSGGPGPDATQPQDSSVTVDAAAGTLRPLDRCNKTADCSAGLLCKPLAPGEAARCTPQCTSDGQCFSAGRCLSIGGDQYCVRADVGRTCTIATDCNYACLSPGNFCTVACVTGADCPNGYGCMAVSNQKVCVKAEEYCGGGQTCASLKCDKGMLVSSCTTSCASASDCPQRAGPLAKWTCSAGSCVRPSDVVGPLGQGEPAEYACDLSNKVANLCNDAQHIDFDQFTIPAPPSIACPSNISKSGAPGDACVDSCRYVGGCAYGYACSAVGSVGNQRIGLCLPALGGGEVGASCSRDADCAFGYCSNGKCSRDCSADGLCPTGSSCAAVGGPVPNVENVLPFKRCQ